MVAEVRERWNKFVAAFNALGEETYGMTPTAASVLFVAESEFESDDRKGYRSLQTGVPNFAVFSNDGKIVDITCDYSDCREFWDVDVNNFRARITQAGIEYIKKHLDVFQILIAKQE